MKYGKTKVKLELNQYVNGGVALQLIDKSDNSPFATLSVWLDYLMPDCFYVDVNNCPDAEKFLVSNSIAKPLRRNRQSGFCTYPLYQLIGKWQDKAYKLL